MATKHRNHQAFGLMLTFGMVAAPLLVTGCMTHRGYRQGEEVRVYDADHHDYHAWNNGEVVYYQQWETNTHRDHRDFDRRGHDEQQEYWNWRHSH